MSSLYNNFPNSPLNVQELCSLCGTTPLQEIGDQTYCENCRFYSDKLILDEECNRDAEFVCLAPPTQPQKHGLRYFGSLSKTHCSNSDSDTKSLLLELKEYLFYFKKRIGSYKDLCGAIFYYHNKQALRLTIRDYVQRSQLCARKFNKYLLSYSAFQNSIHSRIDKQDKEDAPYSQITIVEQEQAQSSCPITTEATTHQDTLQVLKNKCRQFLKSISQEILGTIIKGKQSRHEEVIETIVNKMDYSLDIHPDSEHQYKRTVPILVYRGLKKFNHAISFSKYEEICRKHGAKLSRKLYQTLCCSKKNDDAQTNTSVASTFEDKNESSS